MNAVAEFQPPRLPYHPAISERFQIDKSSWKALVEAIYPSAKTTDSVVMALSYCKARKLDIFKKPVHIVPMWDAKANNGDGGFIETVWPGISEIRTTAFRTGQYAGCDEAEFGPDVEKTFLGQKDKWENRRKVGTETVEVTVSFPEWSRITVYREMAGGKICKFVGPKVYWVESYASQGKVDVPNTMWSDRPIGQIEKCAEAAALRRAFPEEIGNQLTAEEMEGRRVDGDFGGAEIFEPAKRQPPKPPGQKADVEDAEVVEASSARREPAKPTSQGTQPAQAEAGQRKASPQAADYDREAILDAIRKHFANCHDDDAIEAIRAKHVMPLYNRLRPGEDQEAALAIYDQAKKRVAAAAEAADAANQEQTGNASAPADGSTAADDDTFPGDRPSTQQTGKAPDQMNAAELIAYHEAYIESWTGRADDLKQRFREDADYREATLSEAERKALRAVWNDKMGELREREG